MMPPACMIWPKTLAKIQEAHSTPTLLLLNPRRTVAQYSLGVVERKRPMQMGGKADAPEVLWRGRPVQGQP